VEGQVLVSPIELSAAVDILRLGIKSGRDWADVADWVVEKRSGRPEGLFFKRILMDKRIHGARIALHREKARARSFELKIFLEILSLHERSQSSLIEALNDFSRLLRLSIRFEQLRKSLFLLPILQTAFCLIFAFVFCILLPVIFPNVFPSFIHFGRWDLFSYGGAGLSLGLLSLWILMRLSQRKLLESILIVPFLSFLSIRVKSGEDIHGAWLKCLDALDFKALPSSLRTEVSKKSQSFEEAIESLLVRLPSPWNRILLGLLWSYRSGIGMVDFLSDSLSMESEQIFAEAEINLRKDSVLSLLPLIVFCFPSCLYLIAGPHFYGLSLEWGGMYAP
jgi:hypothetical protein